MTRKRLSTKTRLAVFQNNGGVCHLCGGKITVGEEWDVSHPIPLEAGGADDESNWQPAHRKCHRVHTATVDAPLIAKVKRVHSKHVGAKVSRNPMPGSRSSGWKKKMDGTVVRREK